MGKGGGGIYFMPWSDSGSGMNHRASVSRAYPRKQGGGDSEKTGGVQVGNQKSLEPQRAQARPREEGSLYIFSKEERKGEGGIHEEKLERSRRKSGRAPKTGKQNTYKKRHSPKHFGANRFHKNRFRSRASANFWARMGRAS